MPAQPIAPNRYGVFTAAQARAAGWTPSAIRHAQACGRWQRMRPGIYALVEPAAADRFDERRRAHLMAAVAAAAGSNCAVLSHTSAALGHGLPVLELPARPCLTVPVRSTRRIARAHVHEADLRPARCHRQDGVRMTDVARTIIDVGREQGLSAGLIVADAALHRGDTTQEDLRCALAECRGWPGLRAARQVLDLADGRSESPLESLSRLVLRNRVPTPDLQSSIFDEHGRFVGRVDMLWPEVGVVGEADGMGKYEQAYILRAEKRRQEELERTGLIVVRWTMGDLAEPDVLVDRIVAAHQRAERPGRVRDWMWRPAAPVGFPFTHAASRSL